MWERNPTITTTTTISSNKMGRPGTPGPTDRPDGSSSGERKATLSGALVLMGILSFVLGVIAVTVPYWGHFRPGGNYLSPGQSAVQYLHLSLSQFFLSKIHIWSHQMESTRWKAWDGWILNFFLRPPAVQSLRQHGLLRSLEPLQQHCGRVREGLQSENSKLYCRR